jgi:hypothetical protein
VQTEIQLADRTTSKRKERGESNHSLYKKRQRSRVRLRLESQGWNLGAGFDPVTQVLDKDQVMRTYHQDLLTPASGVRQRVTPKQIFARLKVYVP